MSAKEKAIELVGKFADIQKYSSMKVVAKNCALIVIDEILNSIDFVSMLNGTDDYNYWKEVKKEIEAL